MSSPSWLARPHPGRARDALPLLLVPIVSLLLLACEPPPPEGVVPAPVPTLPSGELLWSGDRTGRYEIYAMPSGGGAPRQLTDDPAWDSWSPRLSPDRRHVLVHRSPAGVHDHDHTRTSVWRMRADGSELTLLRAAGTDGWEVQGHADWSPDGTELALFGGKLISPRIWIVAAEPGAPPTPVTAPGGLDLDPSWFPDGEHIAFVTCPTDACVPTDLEVHRVHRSGGAPTRLTFDGLRDHDPVVSPDGRRLAWLTNIEGMVWDIRVADVEGAGPRRLVGDASMTSRPEWTRTGDALVFHRFVPGAAGGVGLWRAAPDGSGLTALTPGVAGTEEYPST